VLRQPAVIGKTWLELMGSCIGPELNMMLDALDCALEGVILAR
jgi:hypothetical protein